MKRHVLALGVVVLLALAWVWIAPKEVTTPSSVVGSGEVEVAHTRPLELDGHSELRSRISVSSQEDSGA